MVKTLRRVFKFAQERELGQHNPASEVEYLEPNNPEGFHTWTVEEVRQFEAAYPVGTKQRLALAILLYTGTRRSDAVRLGRQMERDGWLHWTEWKGRGKKRTRKERAIPILPELRAVLDATQSEHLTYITTQHGKSYTADGFGNWWRRKCRAAELPHCTPHGLRKAGSTIAAERGATERQLMAIFGRESARTPSIYTRRADRQKMAGDAMHLISLPADAGTKPDEKCPTVAESGTKTPKNA